MDGRWVLIYVSITVWGRDAVGESYQPQPSPALTPVQPPPLRWPPLISGGWVTFLGFDPCLEKDTSSELKSCISGARKLTELGISSHAEVSRRD